MKKLLFPVILFPMLSFAQDCQLKKSVDAFTHETKVSTGFLPYNFGSLKTSISVDATPSLIDFFVWVKNEGVCFDDNAFAELIFEGEKSKMRVKNTGSMNCEGAFHFSFKNLTTTSSQLAKIASKKIATIKLTGNNKSETIINLSEEQKQMFMDNAACIANEAKNLIK